MQKAHTDLDMEALYPSLAPLPLSVTGDATRHKEKTYGRVLKTRVSEVKCGVSQSSEVLPE
jgi:hypothetical protein